jgi:hypothetical protein
VFEIWFDELCYYIVCAVQNLFEIIADEYLRHSFFLFWSVQELRRVLNASDFDVELATATLHSYKSLYICFFTVAQKYLVCVYKAC